MRTRSIPLLVFLASTAVAGPVSLASAENAGALAARATKLYRAKEYDEACALFQQVTALTPKSASAWADLGLCLGKLEGRAADAVAANRKAIAFSAGKPNIRKAAMFNLAKLEGSEVKSYIPGPTEDPLRDLEGTTAPCEIYDRAPGCAKPVWGCFAFDIPHDSVRLALDPRKIVGKAFPKVETVIDPDQDPEPILDGNVVLRSMTYLSIGGSADGCDHLSVECSVVWADACAARAGIACTTRWVEGPSNYDEGDDDRCPDAEVLVREIALR
jgi:hypothetical protein